MTVLDLLIVGLIVAVFVAAQYFGMFAQGILPRTGRYLIMAGFLVTGLFYLADLLTVTLLPIYVGRSVALEFMTFLHFEVRWIVSILSLVLIGSGILFNGYMRKRIESKMWLSERKFEKVQQSIIESEIRFRSLVEQTPDAVYCFEFVPPMPIDLPIEAQLKRTHDARLVECNQVFAKSIGVNSPQLIMGMRFGDMDSAHDKVSHEEFFQEFIENGYRLVDRELIYVNRDGQNRALQISMTGVVQSGELTRIWGAEKNILDHKETKSALHDRLSFQQFVADISSRLITVSENAADETLRWCIEEVGRHFGTDRANILWFDTATQSVGIIVHWNEHGAPPILVPSIQNFPWMAPQVQTGQAIRVSSVDDLPPEAAIDGRTIDKLGLKSVAAVPLVVSEETIGLLTFGHITENRIWSDQDMIDLRVIADLFANVVVRIRSRQALDQALSDLQAAKERLEAENVYLQQEIRSTHGFDEVIGQSGALVNCLNQVQQVAATDTTVLVLGETGTGKELIARAIHERSARSARPLVKVNCAALPANLIESELFGHEKGAYTGAVRSKRGRFDLADGGTLFLDEIGDLPVDLQGKLLRVLQEGEFERLGGSETIKVDVRLIAATNQNLRAAVDNAEFRADLFYRINTFPIVLPPLRDRDDDVAVLAEHFVEKYSAGLGKEITGISSSMMNQLLSYSWPGNIRELESVIQRALILTNDSVLRLTEPLLGILAPQPISSNVVTGGLADLRVMEKEQIETALVQSHWVIAGDSGAANKLGIPPSTLRSKMKTLGVSRPNR